MSLDDCVSEIKPLEPEIKTLKKHRETIKTILEKNAKDLSIKSVRPGGSLEKGTILKNRLEADVVFIVNKNTWRDEIFEDIEVVFKKNLKCETETKKISVEVKLDKPIGTLLYDVIPSLEVNSPLQMSQVKDESLYRGSTTVFQVNYFKQHKNNFPRLEDLVLLLKSWRKKNNVPISNFILELIAIEAMYRHNIKQPLSDGGLMANFKVLRRMMQGSPIYPRDWVFNKSVCLSNKRKELLIIDPGDPSNNLTSSLRKQDITKIRNAINKAMINLNQKRYSSMFNC